jgi:hypothetical protein
VVASGEDKAITLRHWHKELEGALIDGGLKGWTEVALNKHFRGRVDPEDLHAYLEVLVKEDRAQKFKFKRNVIWRATINIRGQ